MKKILILTVIVIVLLNIPKHISNAVKNDKDLTTVVNESLPSNSTLIRPEQPLSTKPFQLYDLNNDGIDEVIVNYKLKTKEQPSQFGAIVLKKENDEWENIWETKSQGVVLDYSGLADITRDGTKEYVFGVTIGASAGSHLYIYKWVNNSLKKVADVNYHKMEIISNNNIGIAVWQRFIADTYFVNVLSWDGNKLVHDEELYYDYYPIIEKYLYEKLSEMDAWFYWYTLADAQIKANLFEKAEKSIQNGIAIVRELGFSEEVEKFNKLKVILETKKRSN
ncbi:hypothetical protein CIB95_03860 [Lottiidibacillus patelloidae]|uniref:VCBS repeat-containing protein n=1 Tax=Lottiidibacillus patelloidae TaxID=2670334 RepID=A0A263BYC2_9BACI|nr:hypothetical protein [Lottiidibacillus patelloidae]OZM58714.1 hypothetical protein CIB95_03860 [Lottiidibacillus patelloidae]